MLGTNYRTTGVTKKVYREMFEVQTEVFLKIWFGAGQGFVLPRMKTIRLFETSLTTRPETGCDIPVRLNLYVLFVACLIKSLHR